MIFEFTDDGLIAKLDKVEFLEIVDDFIRENREAFLKFGQLGVVA